MRPGWFAQASAGLLVGGAIGNVIDRILYGAVADFLNMSLPNWRNPYSFNVADIAIFLGALGLVLQPPEKKPEPKKRRAPAKPRTAKPRPEPAADPGNGSLVEQGDLFAGDKTRDEAGNSR